MGVRYMSESDHQAAGTWGGDTSINIAPNEDKTVSITFSLAANERSIIDSNFPNGTYVEGFAGLKSQQADSPDLSLPFLAFYGDWEKAPIIDSGSWFNGSSAHVNTEAGWSLANLASFDLGGDIFSQQAIFDQNQNAISPNGDGLDDSIDFLSLGTLRASSLNTYSVTDSKGRQVFSDSERNISKSYYYPTSQSWISFSDPAVFTGKSADQKPLPQGEYTYHVTTNPMIPVGDTGQNHIANDKSTFDFKFKIDTTAPVVNQRSIKVVKDGDKRFLVIPASDNFNLMDALLYPTVNGQPDTNADPISTSPLTGKNPHHDFRLDITNAKSDQVFLSVLDYGYNETDLSVDLSKFNAKKSAGLTIRSTDINGRKIANDRKIQGNVGDAYNITVPSIYAYKFNSAKGAALKGTLTEKPIKVQLIYDKIQKIKFAKNVQVTNKNGAGVYSDFGRTAPLTKQILKNGTKLRVQAAYRIGSADWYQISNGKYIHASDTNQGSFKSKNPGTIRLKRAAKIYRGYGPNAVFTGKLFAPRTVHKIFDAYQVDGIIWYRIGNNLWINNGRA
ncbi:hypothetical protein Q757_02195 [Oenococcus alcoholitolerans]|uniref:Uncharacterized protein n=1 Tax=Oenococcus alcoholitolerans TaxID=931074 RepID=A0ABR4XRX9_9LACO|nr:hypothetical protein Q757_02195 [Oenococcus alcoholitolerans]